VGVLWICAVLVLHVAFSLGVCADHSKDGVRSSWLVARGGHPTACGRPNYHTIMYTTWESQSCEHVVSFARLSRHVVPTNSLEVRAISLVTSCQRIWRQNLPRASFCVVDRSRIAVFGNFSCRPVDFTESVSFYRHWYTFVTLVGGHVLSAFVTD